MSLRTTYELVFLPTDKTLPYSSLIMKTEILFLSRASSTLRFSKRAYGGCNF